MYRACASLIEAACQDTQASMASDSERVPRAQPDTAVSGPLLFWHS